MSKIALLIGVRKKQDFIFSSNQLKTNIGASHLLSKVILEDKVLQVLRDQFDLNSFPSWRELKGELFFDGQKFGVGYLGGGNALLFFDSQEMAHNFVKNFSKAILIAGYNVELEFGYAEFDDYNHNIVLANLYGNLEMNNNYNTVNQSPFKHGIFKSCKFSSGSQQVALDRHMVSTSYSCKNRAAKEAQDVIHSKYEDLLSGKNYAFDTDYEKFEVNKEKRYLAVVHIDGNALGQKFSNCTTLEGVRALSQAISNRLEACERATVEEVIRILDSEQLNDDICVGKNDDGKEIIPFRPIINAGDDITFVCHGKLGLYLARFYINKLRDVALIDSEPIDSCGGVAIIKQKTPFYRAYQWACDMVDHGKRRSRNTPHHTQDKPCFLSFGMSPDSSPPTYDKYIAQNRLKGSYDIDQEWNELLYWMDKFKSFPQNKIAELRQSLLSDRLEIEFLRAELSSRGLNISKEEYNRSSGDNVNQRENMVAAIILDYFYPESLRK